MIDKCHVQAHISYLKVSRPKQITYIKESNCFPYLALVKTSHYYTLKMYIPDLFHPEPPVSHISSHDQSYEHLKVAAKQSYQYVGYIQLCSTGKRT